MSASSRARIGFNNTSHQTEKNLSDSTEISIGYVVAWFLSPRASKRAQLRQGELSEGGIFQETKLELIDDKCWAFQAIYFHSIVLPLDFGRSLIRQGKQRRR